MEYGHYVAECTYYMHRASHGGPARSYIVEQ